MNSRITINNLGPIKECSIDINRFTVLTGPQAGGKSTVAKAMYFFLSIRDDFVSEFSRLPAGDRFESSVVSNMNKRLRSKFLSVFGSSWAMERDMRIICEYSPEIKLTVSLKDDGKGEGKNYIDFAYSASLRRVMEAWEHERYEKTEADPIDVLIERFSALFGIDRDVMYIPAGRGMITLLTDQLGYIFSSADIQAIRSIDYCTRSYVTAVMKLRPQFVTGMTGMLEEKKHLTSDKIDFDEVKCFADKIDSVLKGKYYYQSGEERLYIDEGKYVKINYASSGQQEIVWVLNFLYYALLHRKKYFLILEEPEAHLYPDAQKKVAELVSMFGHAGNSVLITTHSPYVLGQINNMLLASEIRDENRRNTVIDPKQVIQKEEISAFFVDHNQLEDAMDDGLIDNILIDGASKDINTQSDEILGMIWEEEENGNKA